MNLLPQAAGVAYVVPVLPLGGDGTSLATTLLHGRALFHHAVRTAREAGANRVLVTTPSGSVPTVGDELGAEGVHVVADGDTLGASLLRVLAELRSSGDAVHLLAVHDPRCPLVPASFLRETVAQAADHPHDVTVATRPMTDTVKAVVDGIVRATVDRDRLVVVTSPLLMPVQVLERLAADPALRHCVDVDDLVSMARAAGASVRWVPAPGMAWRVDDVSGVSVLESVTDAGRRPR